MPDSQLPQNPDSSHNLPWLKLWSNETLHGSLRFDCTAEERGIWMDLLCLANENRTRGFVRANATTPFPHDYLANMLNLSLDTLEVALAKFEAQGRIHENGCGIEVINFEYYQGATSKMGRPSKPRRPRPANYEESIERARTKHKREGGET